MNDSADPDLREKVNMPFVVLVTVVAALGGFLFGFDSGVINGTVEGLETAFNSNSVGTGFNVASMLLGCAAGAFAAGRLADRFGRRSVLLVAAVCFAISAWGSGIAGSSGEFVGYRVLGGLAVGAASVLSPAYISEMTPARYRGALTSIQQIAIIGGLFLSFVSNFLIAGQAGGALQELAWGYEAWRWMFWVELLPAGLFFFALLCIPESPRYLVSAGRGDRAERVLACLFGPTAASAKAGQIAATLNREHRPRFSDLLRPDGGLRTIVWVGLGLASLQQFVGINVVFYYGSVLWRAVGFTEGNSLLINVISGAVSLGACAVAIAVIDKVGRRPLLLIGSVGMALALGTMAWVFAVSGKGADGQPQLAGAMGFAALIAANLYVAFFNVSWGPVMWVMLGEMFPNQFRGSALAVSGLSQWASNFVVTITFPILLKGAGLGVAYGIYAAFAVASFFFVKALVRETKGMELEEMQG